MSTTNKMITNTTTTEIVEISSVDDLLRIKKFSHLELFDKYFLLTSDIDLSGVDENIFPIVVNFPATFDGGWHRIKNYKGDNCLFRHIEGTGIVKNLTVCNFNISHLYASLYEKSGYGIFSFENYGKIINCSVFDSTIESFCSFSKRNDIGILVSSNYGTISNCVVDNVTVKTPFSDTIGGIAGNNYNTISECHVHHCVLYGKKYIGGICGYNMDNSASIVNCILTNVLSKKLNDSVSNPLRSEVG